MDIDPQELESIQAKLAELHAFKTKAMDALQVCANLLIDISDGSIASPIECETVAQHARRAMGDGDGVRRKQCQFARPCGYIGTWQGYVVSDTPKVYCDRHKFEMEQKGFGPFTPLVSQQ
jgi:hypothetical protein